MRIDQEEQGLRLQPGIAATEGTVQTKWLEGTAERIEQLYYLLC